VAYIKCHLSKILGIRRITQRELARKSGLSNFTVNKFYNERWRGVDQHTLVALCKTLNVQVGDLFEYVENKNRKKNIKPRLRRKK